MTWRKSWKRYAARSAVGTLVLLLSFATASVAGEGDPGGGIGGTGITGFGVVQKFGSIYVNGREYAIDAGTQIVPDGKEGPDQLHLGDVVKVTGVIDAGDRSSALRVDNMLAVRGVVERIQRRGGELVVLGQRIRITPATLQIEAGAATGASTPTFHAGDPVAISALAAANGSWVAFRVVREPREEIHFAVRGSIEAFAPGRTALRIGGRDFALNDAAVPSGLKVGDVVRVDGQYVGAEARADAVTRVAPLFGETDHLIEMSGYARVSASTLACNDVTLRFDDASRFVSGTMADIHNDVPLAVRGERQADGSLLVRQIQFGVEPMHAALPDLSGLNVDGHRGAMGVSGRREIERPIVDRPSFERPSIERPEIERPDIERPDVERPEIELPDGH